MGLGGSALCLGLLCACQAPGYKLNSRTATDSSTAKVAGLSVTLRPIDTALLKSLPASTKGLTGIDELLSAQAQPYRIGPQDILLVTVWEHPELTIPLGQYRSDAATGQVVDEAGNIFYPYAGIIHVAGLTPMEVRDTLVVQLTKVLNHPQVDVKVLAYRSQQVFVGGEVKSPGNFSVTDVPFTLNMAIGSAGGLLPTGDDTHVRLTRGAQTWTFNFHALRSRDSKYGQILLRSGDVIQVPHVQEEPVYLLGEIRQPRVMPLYHGRLSLAQALSESGGMDNLVADARSIYVVRQGAKTDAVDLFHLDVRNPVAMVMADQFQLQARDIVYVDASSLVRWNRVVSLIVPSFTAISNTASTAVDIKYLRKN